MKRFVFKLETLLKDRSRKESEAQKELLKAQMIFEEYKKKRNALYEEKIQLEAIIREPKNLSQTPDDYIANVNYISRLRTYISEAEDNMMRSENATVGKRKALAKAMQDRKVIENLKEKQYAEWQRVCDEVERQFLDEQATLRYRFRNQDV